MFFTATQPQFRRPAYIRTDRTLERFLSNAVQGNPQPSPQYSQDENCFHLTLDLPGIAKEHLSISIEGAVVRLQTKEDAKRQFRAAYELPQEIDASLSEAKLENGVLNLKLGKKTPISNATELTIG